MTNGDDIFCLDDYDCIGFDMDHTIVQYHLPQVFKVNNKKINVDKKLKIRIFRPK